MILAHFFHSIRHNVPPIEHSVELGITGSIAVALILINSSPNYVQVVLY